MAHARSQPLRSDYGRRFYDPALRPLAPPHDPLRRQRRRQTRAQLHHARPCIGQRRRGQFPARSRVALPLHVAGRGNRRTGPARGSAHKCAVTTRLRSAPSLSWLASPSLLPALPLSTPVKPPHRSARRKENKARAPARPRASLSPLRAQPTSRPQKNRAQLGAV